MKGKSSPIVDSQELVANGEASTHAHKPLTLSLVATDEAFDELEGPWKHLADNADCTVFQSFEWLRTWWEHFKTGRELHCLAFKDEERVVGIAPLFLEKVKIAGVRLVTVLRFFSGEPDFYTDLIVWPGYEREVQQSVAAYLRSVAGTWDIFEMPSISERLPLLTSFPPCLESVGIKIYTYRTMMCSHVPLPGDWDGFLQYIGKKRRHELKRKTERLQESSQIETCVIQRGTEEVRTAMRDMISIHGRRWESLGFKNRYNQDNELSFLTRFAERASDRGWLKIMFLKVNGEKVAGLLNFDFHDRTYCYHANAFGPDEVMKYSPGILLHYSAIQQGIGQGIVEYDMMTGDQEYKLSEVRSVAGQLWQIRGISPSGLSRFRFSVFTWSEIARKGVSRALQEYHIFKRFYLTKKPSALTMLKFAGSEFKRLLDYERHRFPTLFSGEKIDGEKKPTP